MSCAVVPAWTAAPRPRIPLVPHSLRVPAGALGTAGPLCLSSWAPPWALGLTLHSQVWSRGRTGRNPCLLGQDGARPCTV